MGSSFPVGKVGSSEIPQTAPPTPQDPEELVSPGPTNRKPKAAVTQVGIESFSGDTRLHHHGEIFCIQLSDSVHMGQVNAHSTLYSTDSPLNTGASAKRDDGNTLVVAQGCQAADLVHILRPHHNIGRLAPMHRLVMPVMLSDGRSSGHVGAPYNCLQSFHKVLTESTL